MESVLKKYRMELEKHVSKVNKYSTKNKILNMKSKWLVISSIFIPIVFLKLTRSKMIELPSVIFYIIVYLLLIIPFIITIVSIRNSHKKYVKKIDKNINSIYENLNSITEEIKKVDKDYKKRILKKLEQVNIYVLIDSVNTSAYVNDDNILEYTFDKNSFKERENIFNKEIYMDNQEKVKYLKESIEMIEKVQSSSKYKEIYDISSNNLVNKYLPECDYKNNIINIKKVFKIMENYYNSRKKLLIDLKTPLDLGLNGEKFVNEYLKMYEDEIINLTNIRLEIDGNSIENDNILITRKGIFILEVKNIGSTGSYSILIESDGRWSKQFKNGQSEVIEFNATEQNDRHIAILKKFINKKLDRSMQQNNYLQVEGIVVIANNKLDIKNESTQKIYRVSEVYRFISKFDDMLTYEEMLKIKDIILQENLKPKKYPILDYRCEIKNNIKLFDEIFNKLDYEKQNLFNIQDYLKEIGYIEFDNEFANSNIINKISGFKNSIKKICSKENYSDKINLPTSNNYSCIEITVNKERPIIISSIIFLVIGLIIVKIMGLVDFEPELNKYYDESKQKYGLKNKYGILVLGTKYDGMWYANNGMYLIKSDEKYGLVNKVGDVIVKPKYDDINVSKTGVIGVEKDGKWSIINESGKKINNKIYDSISSYVSYELTEVCRDGKIGYVNKDGKEIIKPIYDEVEYMKDGLFSVKKDGKYGLLDSSGKKILPIEYQYIDINHRDTYILVKKDNKFGIVDPKTAKLVCEPKYQKVVSDGSRIKVKLNDKWGFLSKKTYKELLEPKYDYIDDNTYSEFREVRLNNKVGVINDKYELIIPTEYDEIIENFDGQFRLMKNGKPYYIDINNLDNLVSCANEISGKWNINGNQYITYVHGTGQASNIILNDEICSDIQVETDIQIGGSMLFGTSGNAGILFRSDKNAENAYFIMIQSINGGELLLGKFSPEWEVITRESININSGTTYKLKVEAKGNNIKAYIGDMEKPLIDIIDDTFTSGYIGLRAWDADAGFENINARKY